MGVIADAKGLRQLAIRKWPAAVGLGQAIRWNVFSRWPRLLRSLPGTKSSHEKKPTKEINSRSRNSLMTACAVCSGPGSRTVAASAVFTQLLFWLFFRGYSRSWLRDDIRAGVVILPCRRSTAAAYCGTPAAGGLRSARASAGRRIASAGCGGSPRARACAAVHAPCRLSTRCATALERGCFPVA